MLNTEFNAWLHGYFTLIRPRGRELTLVQNTIIRSHIDLVHEACEGVLTITNACIYEALQPADKNSVGNLNRHLVAFINTVASDFERKPISSGAEVAYFLQGFFEIGEEPQTRSWSRDQCRAVLAVMNRNVDGLHPLLLNVYWKIRRFLSTESSEGEGTLETSEIKRHINGLFEHVIDPSYGFSEERTTQLQAIHDAYKPLTDA